VQGLSLLFVFQSKDVQLDAEVEKSKKQDRDVQKLTKDAENLRSQIEKLQDFEHRSQELTLQTSVYEETIATLQKDLVSEKLINEKCKNNLEKLCLNMELLDNDVDAIVEHVLKNSKLRKSFVVELRKESDDSEVAICSRCEENVHKKADPRSTEMVNLQNANETMQAENARLQVDIATLKSQVHSLQTQQTALQLANSQLVAEKDEVKLKKIKILLVLFCCQLSL
jgi:uncharacterized coiled-coil protein SlyX